MIFFYVPFYYTIITRLHRFSKIVSWFIIYVIPQFLFMFYFFGVIDFVQTFFKIALGVTLIYTLYEIGYIYNDTETIKNESNPTLRLNSIQFKYYGEHKLLIYSLRFLIAISISFVLLTSCDYYFVILVWCIIPLYAIYNSMRSIWNLPLHFCLVVIRYCSVIVLSGFESIPFLYCMLLFPLINFLERCSEKRFELPWFQFFLFSNKKDGRYKYYFILMCIACSLSFYSPSSFNLTFLCLSVYYFLYRLLLVKFKMV